MSLNFAHRQRHLRSFGDFDRPIFEVTHANLWTTQIAQNRHIATATRYRLANTAITLRMRFVRSMRKIETKDVDARRNHRIEYFGRRRRRTLSRHDLRPAETEQLIVKTHFIHKFELLSRYHYSKKYTPKRGLERCKNVLPKPTPKQRIRRILFLH